MIRGTLVTLRPVEDVDLPLIHVWQNDPEVWQLMDYERPFSLEDITDDAERSRAEGHPFVIELDGRPIGRIGLNQFRGRDRICSLYVFIGDRNEWGKGYGRDAIVALLGYAFDRLDLHQVELWSLESNQRAIRAYERCGFVREAALRDRSFKDGSWENRVIMSVRRGEFEQARAKLGLDSR